MRRFVTALTFSLALCVEGSHVHAQQFVEPANVVNGWGIVLTFDSSNGPEPDHSHWFYGPKRYATQGECDAAAHGEDGDFAARFSAMVIQLERAEGYTVSNIELDCRRLPESVKNVKDAGEDL